MDAEIARADFLDGCPFAGPTGAPAMMAKEDWDDYGGVGDYATANGNTHAVMTAGHGIRDALYTGQLKTAAPTGVTFDCVVVGGGISGLAAAHLYSEKTGRSKHCLVLEDHAIFGGEARRNEFMVDGQRLMAGQGSATYFPSLPTSLTQGFYESIGFDGKPLEYQKWGGGQPELDVNTLPYARGGKNSGMFFGARFGHPEGLWPYDPWGKKLAGAPLPEATRQQLLKVRAGNQTFAPPKVDGDEISRALDRITLEEHRMQRDGRLHTVHARSVVMSAGWTTAKTISDLPEEYRAAYQQFYRMPCGVINIALRNWRFMAKMGITECQCFEGIYPWLAVRKVALCGDVPPTVTPDDPTVLRLKITFTEPGLPLPQQCTRGRMRLLSTPYSEYERMIREQMTLMFARSGFDARRDIAGIIVNRWGHAYLCGQPGFFFGSEGKIAPREVMRRAPFGKIAFANSDLSGIMDHRASIAESDRAVNQLLA
jgi:hypothetical protein